MFQAISSIGTKQKQLDTKQDLPSIISEEDIRLERIRSSTNSKEEPRSFLPKLQTPLIRTPMAISLGTNLMGTNSDSEHDFDSL